jgi:hypothetical protein
MMRNLNRTGFSFYTNITLASFKGLNIKVFLFLTKFRGNHQMLVEIVKVLKSSGVFREKSKFHKIIGGGGGGGGTWYVLHFILRLFPTLCKLPYRFLKSKTFTSLVKVNS